MRKFRKPLGLLFILLFTASLFFPIVAALVNRSGKILQTASYFDVVIAILCFSLFVLFTIAQEKSNEIKVIKKSQKVMEYAASVPLLLIALYFLGIKVNWTILLVGLGWRFWLLIMATPYLVAIFHKSAKYSAYDK